MPFLLLLFLVIACLPPQWEKPWDWLESSRQSATLTGLVVAINILVAALLSWRIQRRCKQGGGRDLAGQSYSTVRFYHFVLLMISYSVVLYGLGWGWAVQSWFGWKDHLAPGAELLILAPFVVALLSSWLCFYGAERAMHGEIEPGGSYWNRRAYLGFHIRQNLVLVSIPLTLMIAEKALRGVLPEFASDWQDPILILGFLGFLGVFVGMPWVLRLLLGLKPLPESLLRDRLASAARRLRFRCSDILLWNTRGGVANAMVAGVLPIPRYVVLTDRLIADLTPEEIEAVFGHEIGHVKHWHMLYYFSFLVVSVLAVASLLADYFPDLDRVLHLDTRQDLAVLPAVAGIGTYIFVVFGFLSRRCERQADIYGCRAVSCKSPTCEGHDEFSVLPVGGTGLCPTGIRTFISALEKVARLNGMRRDKPGLLQSWMHSTIARRVDFLQSVLIDPELEPRFQRTVFFVKSALLLGLAGLVLYLGMMNGWRNLQF